MKKKTVTVTELKTKCTALLDEVEHDRVSVTVTRRGQPVAVLSPASTKGWKSPRDTWAGKLRIVGDIVNLDTSNLCDVVSASVIE